MSEELEITEANFETETASGVTMIDFWAPWCGPCKMQGPIVDKVAGQMSGKAKVGKCNIDDAQKIASKLGIRSIPTLMIFKDGEEAERLVGLQTEQVLLDKLNALVG